MSTTDPTDDSGAAIDATAGSVSAESPTRTIADREGGVARRLTKRSRIAASVLLVIGGIGGLLGVVRPWTTMSAIAALLAAGALVAAVVLFRRAGLWSSVAACPLPDAVTPEAIVGPPQRLSPGLSGAPLKRRLGAMVVPIHADVGPQPGGGALVVHARADGLQLAAGDRVGVWRATRGALGSMPSGPGPTDPGHGRSARSDASGRFVLYRPRDDAVFLATTRLSDTW